VVEKSFCLSISALIVRRFVARANALDPNRPRACHARAARPENPDWVGCHPRNLRQPDRTPVGSGP